MFGLIIHFGFISVFSYGLLLAIGMFAAAFVFWQELSHTSWDEDQSFSILIKSLFWSFILSRLIFILLFKHLSWRYFFDWNQYPGINGWLLWLFFWFLTWYQVWKNKLETWRFLDIVAWASLVFYFWLSLACIGGWCWLAKVSPFHFGWPVIGFIGVRYPVALFHLILVLGLLLFFRKNRFRFKTLKWYKSGRAGFVFWFSQALYALSRAVLVDAWLEAKNYQLLHLSLNFYFWLFSGLVLAGVFLFWADILAKPDFNLLKLKQLIIHKKKIIKFKKGKQK